MTSMNISTNGPVRGLVLSSTHARFYDIGAWLLLRGRRKWYRQRVLEMAWVRPGSCLLDVGCGTGSLLIECSRAGAAEALGVDASPDMLAIARRKAMRAGVDATFKLASAEALPCADGSRDVVFNTIMLHQLPRMARLQCAREMRRVMKPDGRLLVVEFGAFPSAARGGWPGHAGRHGQLPAADVAGLLLEAGLTVLQSGAVGIADLHYTLARP